MSAERNRCWFCRKPFIRNDKPCCDCSQKVWIHPDKIVARIEAAVAEERERLLAEIKHLLRFASCSCCHAIEAMIRGEPKE